jgi:hypothetical protein
MGGLLMADQPAGPQATREEMQQRLAQQFGFNDFETFRQEAARTMGKAGLKKLEKELEKYPSSANQ